VGLGSYIVNAHGACNDCHTNPSFAEGHDPFLGQPEQINRFGYLAGGVPFGPFVSRNLTPNAQGKPAGLTLDQFLETIHTGKDQKNRHPQISPLLQVMPWPVYGKMSDRDLGAVYEYLRSIPSHRFSLGVPGVPGSQLTLTQGNPPTLTFSLPGVNRDGETNVPSLKGVGLILKAQVVGSQIELVTEAGRFVSRDGFIYQKAAP